MSSESNTTYEEKPGIKGWIDYRFPMLFGFLEHFASYQTPKNLSYAWNFGSLAGLALVIQIVTGIILAMHYTPQADMAFDSVESIMRDVNYGWLIRYTHAVGASLFFFVVYLHIGRGIYYGSYKKPRELLWLFGIVIFLIMMATAFMGYVLPWGQMSFWAATVITSLFSVIPIFGDDIVHLLWGGFSVGNPTLNRFFALHYLLPFVLVALSMLHMIALHQFGSNNPTGVEIKTKKDTIPFHPYYTIKDSVTVGIFLFVLFAFVCFAPNAFNHPDNYIEANPLVTPAHIVPEWYFLPFYAMLRAIPNKMIGVMALFGSILVLAFLPWLDQSPVKSANYRPTFRLFYIVFILDFILLMWLGGKEVVEPFVTMSRIATLYYFGFLLVIIPILGKYEKTLPLPDSISSSCHKMQRGHDV